MATSAPASARSNATIPVLTRVSPDVRRGIDELARRNDRSVSAEIRRALVKHLDTEHATAA